MDGESVLFGLKTEPPGTKITIFQLSYLLDVCSSDFYSFLENRPGGGLLSRAELRVYSQRYLVLSLLFDIC